MVNLLDGLVAKHRWPAVLGWAERHARVRQIVRSTRNLPLAQRQAGWSRLQMAYLTLGDDEARRLMSSPSEVGQPTLDLLAGAGIVDRSQLVDGDFFAAVPAGDAYVLAQILHAWNVDRCVTILQQCRRAISPRGKVLVVELYLPSDEEPFFGKWLDLHIMVVPGGHERSAAGPSVVEAVPI